MVIQYLITQYGLQLTIYHGTVGTHVVSHILENPQDFGLETDGYVRDIWQDVEGHGEADDICKLIDGK